MDPNYILELIVLMSCAANLVRAVRNPSGPLVGWIVTVIAILAVVGGLYLRHRDFAGYVGAGLWVLFLVTPSLLRRHAGRLAARQKYRSAGRWARAAAIVHPLDGWMWQPRMFLAMELAEQGSIALAVEALETFEAAPARMRRAAMVQRFRIESRWDDLIAWVREQGEGRLLREGGVAPLYCRALGETGQIDAMIEAFAFAEPFLESASQTLERRLVRLMVFAFCGDGRETAAILFGNKSLSVPEPVARFWLATAAMAAGDPLAAADLQLLREVATRSNAAGSSAAGSSAVPRIESSSPGLVRAIDVRLARPLAPAAGISARSRAILQHAIEETRHDERYVGGPSSATPLVTYVLIALNLALFIAEEALGGATNEDTLQKLGAAVPDLVAQGQWWRLLAANFLHFGVAHIVMNMFGLLVIGPFVERTIGAFRYTIVYLVSGVGAVGFVVGMNIWLKHDETLVGASGAIMGLIGATGAILLRGWMNDRARVALRRLRLIVIVVGLQVLFDSLTPAVSGSAHLAGLVIGFLATMPIRARAIGLTDDETVPAPARAEPINSWRA